jgi:hypothetical protein
VKRLLRLLPFLCVAVVVQAAMRPVSLKCEFGAQPLGIDVAQPRLFWQVADERSGACQTAYQVRVASTAEDLLADRADLWDSGRVAGDATTFVRYAGRPLASSQRVYWQVRVWDAAGVASDWSAISTWMMGQLAPGDWRGRWVQAGGERLENTLLRREFTVKPGLVRAVAHASGLGHYELFLNGRKVGEDLLTPGWTDYRDVVLYQTYDVTYLLRPGANAAGFSLGNGMFHVARAPGRFAKFVGSFGAQRALLDLRLEYADGTVETLGTDETWRTHAGPITFSSIYGGEDYDARREPRGWKETGFDDAAWKPAVAAPADLGRLAGFTAASEPVRVIASRTPVNVREVAPGVQLHDFGQNASFIPRLRISGPAGARVKLTAGEIVNADGTINRDTMGGAHRGSAWWQFTKATDGEETWFPQFYYVGSRYLYVELEPAAAGGERPKIGKLEQVIVHAAVGPVGEFAASDPRLGRIRDLIRWAQRSNIVSILTDCPHREKLGWLEQVHLNGPALRYEWDVTRLMAKTVADIADAQLPDGKVPNIAPEYTEFKGTFRHAAEWGATFVIVPWQQRLFTGDDAVLRQHHDALGRYFAALDAEAGDGPLKSGLGDWYDVQLGSGKRANLTPGPITATAHHFLDAQTLAASAQALGRTAEAATFARRADEIAAVFRREFRRPGTAELYGSGSDTSLALALALDLAAPEDRAATFAALVRAIEARGYSTSGAVGYRYLLRALTDGGRADLILKTALNDAVPGYAYQLKQGATALPESWVAAPGASQNHFFLGQILEWFYADLAGLAPDPAQPGFKRMIVRPQVVDGLTWVEASHQSLHGRHAVRWERADGRFTLRVTVPANTTARVFVPGEYVQAPTAATAHGRDGDRAVFDVPAGVYEFTSSR